MKDQTDLSLTRHARVRGRTHNFIKLSCLLNTESQESPRSELVELEYHENGQQSWTGLGWHFYGSLLSDLAAAWSGPHAQTCASTCALTKGSHTPPLTAKQTLKDKWGKYFTMI